MWIPAALVYVVAALALFVGWMRQAELRMRKAEASRIFVDTPSVNI
jgi:hypothetical protein